MGPFGLWIGSWGEVPGVARTARRPGVRAERTRGRGSERSQSPAPSEANPRRRAKPIPRAERSQSGPPRRRANPGVQEGRSFVREYPPGGPGPAAPAPSEANPPAPSEANSSRRPKPIPRAERSQSPAPSEPGSPRRFTAVRLRAGRGRDARPRAARDRIAKGHPISSHLGAPAFTESAAGCESAPRPGRPGAGISGLKPTHDLGGRGSRRADPGIPADPQGCFLLPASALLWSPPPLWGRVRVGG